MDKIYRHICMISKYIPSRLFGFCTDTRTGQEIFFHLGVFVSDFDAEKKSCSKCDTSHCKWADGFPPPILGEPVEIEANLSSANSDKAPKAISVKRIQLPKVIVGRVHSFDPRRGFGFALGDDGVTYHLHRSEILDGRLPLQDKEVIFYAGVRNGRPRACHVQVCN